MFIINVSSFFFAHHLALISVANQHYRAYNVHVRTAVISIITQLHISGRMVVFLRFGAPQHIDSDPIP